MVQWFRNSLYAEPVVKVWTDTDFAGCPETKKSTAGGIIKFNGHLIKHWSSTQKIIALPSGEASRNRRSALGPELI